MKKTLLYSCGLAIVVSLMFTNIACDKSPTRPNGTYSEFASTSSDTLIAVEFSVPRSFADLDRIKDHANIKVETVRLQYPGFETQYDLDGRSPAEAQADFSIKHQRCLADLRQTLDQLGDANMTPGLRGALSQAMAEANLPVTKFTVVGLRVPRGYSMLPSDAHIRPDILLQRPERVQRQAQPNSTSHPDHAWAPYEGLSSVGRDYTSQAFRFNTYFGGLDTYEHEVQVARSDYADYAGYTSSTMPEWYVHNETPNNSGWDTFVVGSARANRMGVGVYYYTYQSLKPQAATSSTMSLKGQLHRRLFTGAAWWMAQLIDTTVPGLTSYTIPGQVHWYY